jgi:hypothetical protein
VGLLRITGDCVVIASGLGGARHINELTLAAHTPAEVSPDGAPTVIAIGR